MLSSHPDAGLLRTNHISYTHTKDGYIEKPVQEKLLLAKLREFAPAKMKALGL